MCSVNRAMVAGVAGLLLAITPNVPLFGQASFNTSIQTTDFSGEWTEIPHEISVDVTPLVDLDASLHVRDLVIPENVHVQTDGDELIARVLPPRIEEEPEVEEEALEGEAAEGEEGAEGAEVEAQAGEAETTGSEDEPGG